MEDNLQKRLAALRELRQMGFRYIARAEHGELRAFKKKPIRQINFWNVKGELPHPIETHDFDDVKWSDKEPMNILSEIKYIAKAVLV